MDDTAVRAIVLINVGQ